MTTENRNHSPLSVNRPERAQKPRWRRMVLAGTLLLGVVLSASMGGAAAPAGRYTVSGSVVLDNKTGLVWQRSPGTADTDYVTYDDALKRCNNPSLPGTGWRLPSVKELLTIVDDTQQFPAWDTAAFPDTGFYYFWAVGGDVFFAAGTTNGFRALNLVRCVR